MTYTCALLEVAPATYRDIKARIGKVNQHGDYDHMFHGTDKGQGIDLTHIMVIAEPPPPSRVEYHTRRSLLDRIKAQAEKLPEEPTTPDGNFLFGVPIEEYTEEEALAVLPVLHRMYCDMFERAKAKEAE